MNRKDEVEWKQEELEELNHLPTERKPRRVIEHQLVARLQSQGLINRKPGWWAGSRLAWASAAAAACLAFFLGGLSLGQTMGAQSTVDALTTLRSADPRIVSAHVQQTGSAYVNALSALTKLATDQNVAESQHIGQGREVAVAILRAAATQLIRLDPNDPVATHILQGLEAEEKDSGAEKQKERRVFWF